MSNRILQTDPRAGYLEQRDALDRAVVSVLEGGWYVLGEEVRRFEDEFAQWLGVGAVVGVASGTDAIELALRCSGIGRGDVVATAANTASATATAIIRTGARVLLVDVDPADYTMDVEALEEALAEHGNVRAVVPISLYGHPVRVERLGELSRAYGFRVIEDCAQSHGAAVKGRKSGTWCDAGAFSFYPTKNLGCFGDGGAVAFRDSSQAERGREIRQYGWRERYVSERPGGMNSRLDELQASFLRVKLPGLDAANRRRMGLAACYRRGLATVADRLVLPRPREGATHVYHQFVVLTPHRDALREFLDESGIGTLIHYPVPIHRQPAFRDVIVNAGRGLAVTERLCGEILSLPLYPQLTEDAVERVCALICSWANEYHE